MPIRKAEDWEGMDRGEILRSMTDAQLESIGTQLFWYERQAYMDGNPATILVCRSDVRQIVTEMVERGWFYKVITGF